MPEQIDIDIKATRQILTNLIRFSFDQEKLMAKGETDLICPVPSYVTNTQEQNRLEKQCPDDQGQPVLTE